MATRHYFEFHNSENTTHGYLQVETNGVLQNSVVFDYPAFYTRFAEQPGVKMDH